MGEAGKMRERRKKSLMLDILCFLRTNLEEDLFGWALTANIGM